MDVAVARQWAQPSQTSEDRTTLEGDVRRQVGLVSPRTLWAAQLVPSAEIRG